MTFTGPRLQRAPTAQAETAHHWDTGALSCDRRVCAITAMAMPLSRPAATGIIDLLTARNVLSIVMVSVAIRNS